MKPEKESRAVACYSRVSTGMQNVDTQEKALKDWAIGLGYQRQIFFRDISTGGTLDRAGIRQMFEAIGKRKIAVVVVSSLDRLSRSIRDVLYMFERMEANRVDFVSLREQVDTRSAAGRLALHMLSAFAQFERERVGERVRAGLDRARAEGIDLGRPNLAQELRERIRLLQAEGVSIRETADSMGISTTTVQKYRK